MANHEVRFLPLAGKTIVVHTVSYFIMGILAASLFDYESLLARPDMACWMRQLNNQCAPQEPGASALRLMPFSRNALASGCR